MFIWKSYLEITANVEENDYTNHTKGDKSESESTMVLKVSEKT